jgi:hypothetical protein
MGWRDIRRNEHESSRFADSWPVLSRSTAPVLEALNDIAREQVGPELLGNRCTFDSAIRHLRSSLSPQSELTADSLSSPSVLDTFVLRIHTYSPEPVRRFSCRSWLPEPPRFEYNASYALIESF